VIEAFGGAGYVEDTGIPRLLRDAQVLPIWEGTTNVLSLDTLRAIQKADALPAWIADQRRRLDGIKEATCATRINEAVNAIERYFGHKQTDAESQQTAARSIAYSIARTEAATLLLEYAQATDDPAAPVAARRWCAGALSQIVVADRSHRSESRSLVD
ncbi:MAG TPA: acyl-CoA dehydrogenase family protein, partial [Gemmatimonadaceae bacterium]|nr:acyl-CoA dehydrogenase family protein [Gemmatimonadaceae bacterium]